MGRIVGSEQLVGSGSLLDLIQHGRIGIQFQAEGHLVQNHLAVVALQVSRAFQEVVQHGCGFLLNQLLGALKPGHLTDQLVGRFIGLAFIDAGFGLHIHQSCQQPLVGTDLAVDLHEFLLAVQDILVLTHDNCLLHSFQSFCLVSS